MAAVGRPAERPAHPVRATAPRRRRRRRLAAASARIRRDSMLRRIITVAGCDLRLATDVWRLAAGESSTSFQPTTTTWLVAPANWQPDETPARQPRDASRKETKRDAQLEACQVFGRHRSSFVVMARRFSPRAQEASGRRSGARCHQLPALSLIAVGPSCRVDDFSSATPSSAAAPPPSDFLGAGANRKEEEEEEEEVRVRAALRGRVLTERRPLAGQAENVSPSIGIDLVAGASEFYFESEFNCSEALSQ